LNLFFDLNLDLSLDPIKPKSNQTDKLLSVLLIERIIEIYKEKKELLTCSSNSVLTSLPSAHFNLFLTSPIKILKMDYQKKNTKQ